MRLCTSRTEFNEFDLGRLLLTASSKLNHRVKVEDSGGF